MINYNNGKYLRTAIQSVLAQTRLPDELIISDDGSADNSIQIIESYMREHSFIKLFKNPTNLGASGNRDNAIRKATSRFVINLDSDDWFTPEVIEKTLSALQYDPEAVVISSFNVCRDEMSILTTIDTTGFCVVSNNRQLFESASRYRKMPGNQFAFSCETYERLGGLDVGLRIYEDWDFVLRATLSGVKWVHSGCVGFFYRKTLHGLSAAGQSEHMKYRLKVISKNLWAGRFNPLIIAGILTLFIVKSFKYLTGRASPLGFN